MLCNNRSEAETGCLVLLRSVCVCVCDRDGFVESSGRCWCVFVGEKVCVCVCVCARMWVCICLGGGGVLLLAHRLGGRSY